MTATNNHPIAIANEAGVEIIPTEGSNSNSNVDEAADSPNVNFNVVDVVPPAPAKSKSKSWPTKEVFTVIGALCVVGGGSYLLAESHATASNKMMNFGSSQEQMQQTAKKGRYKFERFGGDNVLCADSQRRLHPFISYDGVSSSERCGEKCSKCPGKKQGGLVFRGFNYLLYDYRPDTRCDCLVDQPGGMGFDETLCKDEGATSANPSWQGSGEIEKAAEKRCKSGSCPECWRVSSPSSSKGRKSKAPKSSKRPVRKLGQKNDSLLSNVERKIDSQTIGE
eukprot:scaffold19313_cov75-Skeletonema_dohrnii-CCMP3373.AAC.3